MRRLLALLLLLALSACAIPHQRTDVTAEKLAVDEAAALRTVDRYEELRATSLQLLNDQPLATIVRGPLLDIEAGRVELARSLEQEQRIEVEALRLENYFAPVVRGYPMWFVAIVYDHGTTHVKVQVYERDSAAGDWVLMASPELVATTQLPALRGAGGATLVPLDPGAASGLVASPAAAVASYAEALADPESEAAATVVEDGFMRQMRDSAMSAASIEGVRHRLSWQVRDADYALRTDDGGALVFATLQREDSYRIAAGAAIGWPPGSAEQAFLADAVAGTSTLTYCFQVLMYVPPEGDGKPYVLGQYGGVVAAESG